MNNTQPDDIYEIEGIISKRNINGKVQYKVKWEGYPIEESTWEPIENLDNVKEFIDKYEESNKKNKEKRFLSKKRLPEPSASNHNSNCEIMKEKETKKTFDIIKDLDGLDIKDIITINKFDDVLHALILYEKESILKRAWISTQTLRNVKAEMLIDFYEKKIVIHG